MSEKIAKIELNNFAAFEQLSLEFSPGINLIIGANGTGKTQLLKYIYAATSLENNGDKINLSKDFAYRIKGIYGYSGSLDEYIHTNSKNKNNDEYDYTPSMISSDSGKKFQAILQITPLIIFGESVISTQAFHNDLIFTYAEKHNEEDENIKKLLSNASSAYNDLLNNINVELNQKLWEKIKFNSIFIPSKEYLSNASGFLSTVKRREMSFDTTFVEILESAYLPKLQAQLDTELFVICNEIEEIIGGKVVIEGEKFFVKNQFQKLPMIMVAEGHRKLALIYVLIQNGELSKDSIIIWDEPEANLNPKLQQEVVRIIMELARIGAQVFIATHSYFLLKEFDLSTTKQDNIQYITLYRDKDEHNKIKASVTNDYNKIENNPIDEVGMDQLDRKFRRARVIFNDDNNS